LRAIPELVGTPVADATAELEGLGLVVAPEEQFHDDVEEGLVIATNPGPAAEVERGSTVAMAVSKGPDLVTVPDVAGRILSEATRLLRAVGLIPDQAIGPAEGAPFATDIPAGRQIRRGSSVDIYLR
jgi:serine/threonine-protein kinase